MPPTTMKITHRITQTGCQWVSGPGKWAGQGGDSRKEDKASRATKLCKKSASKTAELPGQRKAEGGRESGRKSGCPGPSPTNCLSGDKVKVKGGEHMTSGGHKEAKLKAAQTRKTENCK